HAGEIDMALCAAKALQAHVEALFITQAPPTRGNDVPFTRGTMVATASLDWWAEERERTTRAAREGFAAACNARGIPMLLADDAPRALPVASWREMEGSYLGVAVPRAAAFDLIVAASGVIMEALKDIAEQALLRTRRPVLLAPTRPNTDLTDPAM